MVHSVASAIIVIVDLPKKIKRQNQIVFKIEEHGEVHLNMILVIACIKLLLIEILMIDKCSIED